MRRGADELDSAFGADIRQFSVFREETIAGVQRVAAGFHRQIHQLARVQVTGQGVCTDAVGLIRAFDMQGMAIGVGIDRDRANAHFGASTHDAYRNFTTVGDQNLFYHLEIPKPLEQTTPSTARKTGRRVTKYFQSVALSH